MCDYESVAKSLQCCASDSEPCEHCNCELEECNPKTIMEIAADAIEELLAGLERYRHAAFVISETCVEESKCHISPEEAIKKIRENIYYFRQMPLPEPPKEVQDG